VHIRNFSALDFPAVQEIARSAGGLAMHHPHTYWMMTYSSPHLCLLAEDEGAPVGYVTGLAPFLDLETCFLWQLGVVPRCRRRRVAIDLVIEFVTRAVRAGTRRLLFTIELDNIASFELSKKVAEILGSPDLVKCIGTTGDMGVGMDIERIYEMRLRDSLFGSS
jgi:L-2,4-diaminobutyric acid acetyltransferase